MAHSGMTSIDEANGRIGSKFERRLDVGLVVALLALALVPRILGLGTFLTVDEPNWFIRSARFAQALTLGDWAGTSQTNHPGVTTMWSGTMGLLAYHFPLGRGLEGETFSSLLSRVGEQSFLPTPDMLPFLRFTIAFLSAACVAAAYLLARRTFDRKVALLGAIFIALDPFFVAHSRILHQDALASMFMMLAVLAGVTYLVADRKLMYLVVSGMTTSLAGLSKASSLALGPCVVFLFGVVYLLELVRNRGQWRQIVFEGLRGLVVWGTAAAVTFYVVWPAMWDNPVGTLWRMLTESAELAEGGHMQFFHGQILGDAGVWFYPVVLLFRTTPFTLVGLVCAVVYLVIGRGRSASWQRARSAVILYLLYAVAFAIFITFSPKKQDRYLLPVLLIIDFCAAWGLLGITRLVVGRVKGQSGVWWDRLSYGVVALCLVAMVVVTVIYHPYYLSFYNPLVGGSAQAQKELLIGWGEGMDLVGRYLNQKEDAASLTVAAVPFSTLVPFFQGTVMDYLTSNAPALTADYVVTYVSQVQRMGPDRELWKYFQHQTPEAVFRLHGLDYAWLYRGPRCLIRQTPDLAAPVGEDFDGKLRLLGYDADVRSGRLILDLFWQILDTMDEDYRISVRLLDDGHCWSHQESGLVNGLLSTSQSPKGYVVCDQRVMSLPAGLPAGSYQIEIYAYSPDSGDNLPVRDSGGSGLVFGLKAGSISLPKQYAGPGDVDLQHRIDAELVDGIKLLGYNLLTQQAQPGEALSLILCWQALAPIASDYGVRLWFETADGAVGEVENVIAGGEYPTTRWLPGDVVKDWQNLPIPRETQNGTYNLMVALFEVGGSRSDVHSSLLGQVEIAGRPHSFDLPQHIEHPAQTNFAGQIEWLGHDLSTHLLEHQTSLHLTLYWHALSPMTTNYKVFVHIIGSDGQIWGQRDTIPRAGSAPTTSWLKGEVISDTLEVTMDRGFPAGQYSIAAGWYNESSGERLEILDDGGHSLGDYMLLQETLSLSRSE